MLMQPCSGAPGSVGSPQHTCSLGPSPMQPSTPFLPAPRYPCPHHTTGPSLWGHVLSSPGSQPPTAEEPLLSPLHSSKKMASKGSLVPSFHHGRAVGECRSNNTERDLGQKIFKLILERKREGRTGGGRGTGRETLICCSAYSSIHWLILVCAPTRD